MHIEGNTQGQRTSGDLFTELYETLRASAHARMACERRSHTFSPTELVHEAFLRLYRNGSTSWNSRGHFYCAAAEAMRRILVERARRARRMRHGGGLARIRLDDVDVVSPSCAEEVILLDDAITRLESLDPRKATIVKLRFFVGLTIDETARELDISMTTVKEDWAFARAWLLAKMTPTT